MATQLVTAIGGNVDHFIANQGNLNKLDKDEQIELLELKQEDLKKCLEKKPDRSKATMARIAATNALKNC